MSGARMSVAAAFVAAAVTLAFLAWRRRRVCEKRLIRELLKGYFEGRMAAGQINLRARESVGRQSLQSPEFQALAVTAFRRAANTKLAQEGFSAQDEGRLLRLSGDLEREFGLPERYRIEGW
jgi:hypothetical protein